MTLLTAGALAALFFGLAAAADIVAAPAPASIEQVVAAARHADIVALGEIHDNPDHHRVQAAVVAALRPAALVFEMIPAQREHVVNALRAAHAPDAAIAAALDWDASGWPAFRHYAAILAAAPDAQVFGGGQSNGAVRRAARSGAADAFGVDAARFGLDRPLPPEEQAAREALQAASHCDALPAALLPGMVEAQRFRDAALADAALRAWAQTGGQVAVITGSGHAHRTRGMPAAIAVADPAARVITLGQFEAAPDDADAYDLHLLAPAPPRADPCATLSGG